MRLLKSSQRVSNAHGFILSILHWALFLNFSLTEILSYLLITRHSVSLGWPIECAIYKLMGWKDKLLRHLSGKLRINITTLVRAITLKTWPLYLVVFLILDCFWSLSSLCMGVPILLMMLLLEAKLILSLPLLIQELLSLYLEVTHLFILPRILGCVRLQLLPLHCIDRLNTVADQTILC